ncbi:3'-5' exonuclease [Flavihumibacter sp. R14]|nr:3'-5' exonuclease [Flavihumibacter soli]
MKLNLKRPLAFFDLETTGVNIASDRIVEISILKAMPDGTEQIKTLRINPEMAIPLESSLVHGIYAEDIKDQPTFKEVAKELADFMDDSDLAGYNSNKFDIPMLMEEFIRAGVDFDLEHRRFVDVQNIFHQMEQRTLRAAYQFYCGKTIENAHSAEADIKATYEVLLSQLAKYENVEWEDKKGNKSIPVKNDVDSLHNFTNLSRPVDFAGRMVYNEHGVELINFGKHKGKCVEEVFQMEPSYYSWVQKGDFPLYTKRCMEKIWIRWNGKKERLKIETQTRLSIDQRSSQVVKPQPSPQPREEAKPINSDMLEQLKMKFGK